MQAPAVVPGDTQMDSTETPAEFAAVTAQALAFTLDFGSVAQALVTARRRLRLVGMADELTVRFLRSTLLRIAEFLVQPVTAEEEGLGLAQMLNCARLVLDLFREGVLR